MTPSPDRRGGAGSRCLDQQPDLVIALQQQRGASNARSSVGSVTTLSSLRVESVVTIDGDVKARSDSTVNPNLPTGAIEVYARGATVLSAAEELPMPATELIPLQRSIGDTKRVLTYYRPSPDGKHMIFGGRARFTAAPPDCQSARSRLGRMLISLGGESVVQGAGQ